MLSNHKPHTLNTKIFEKHTIYQQRRLCCIRKVECRSSIILTVIEMCHKPKDANNCFTSIQKGKPIGALGKALSALNSQFRWYMSPTMYKKKEKANREFENRSVWENQRHPPPSLLPVRRVSVPLYLLPSHRSFRPFSFSTSVRPPAHPLFLYSIFCNVFGK